MNYFLTAFLKTRRLMRPGAEWTDPWNDPTLEPEVVVWTLQSLFNAMMQSPEFQLY